MSTTTQTKVYTWSDELEIIPQRNIWADAFERFRQNRAAMVSLAFITFMLLVSVFGPMVSPYDYRKQDLLNVAQPPTAEHWFGTDSLGRDYLTRIMMGGRTAFFVAFFVVTITTVLGVALGAISAFYGGWVDIAIMRLTDTLMSFPHLLLAVFVVAVVRQSAFIDSLASLPFIKEMSLIDYLIVFGCLSIIGWSGKARLIRGQVLSLMKKEYIEAERAIGAPSRMIIRDHLIPNAMGPIIVAVSAQFGGNMLAEASLSFLGIGIRPPGASWGNMINENLVTWRYQPHLLAMPGIVLALMVLAFNFLGDGVNDAMNPRQRRKRAAGEAAAMLAGVGAAAANGRAG